MTLIGRFKAAASSFLTSNTGDDYTTSFINRLTTSGVSVSQSNSMTLSPYFAAIRNISEDMGKMPTQIFEKLPEKVGGKKLLVDHTVNIIFSRQPNEDMTPTTFKETVQSHALGWGNGYAEIIRNQRGEVVELIPIHPARVIIRRNESKKLEYLVYPAFNTNGFNLTQSGEAVILKQENMFHIKGLTMDGLQGYNTTQLAADSIGAGIATQLFGGSFSKTSSPAPAIVPFFNAL